MPAGVWTWLGLVGVEAATSSVALTEARQCMLLGGSLDLFRSGTEHAPRCIWQPCPVGAEKAEGSCVAPRRTGQAREIAMTLHSPCSSCWEDGGVELAGRLWLALAAALQVPLQEMHVSVLLMREKLWGHHPLQHFTLESPQGPLVTPHGGVLLQSAADLAETWDFFMAVRIHTDRIDPGDPQYLQIMAQHPGPIREATRPELVVNIFEVRQMATAQVTPMEHLSASFRIRGLPWGQEPPDGGSGVSEAASAGDPRLRGTTSRPVQAQEPVCPCIASRLGDGFCHQMCNIEACDWDGGDCATTTSRC